MVQLKGYKLNSVYFENKVAGNTKLALQNQVKYNVNYIEDERADVSALLISGFSIPICSRLKLR